MTRIAQVSAPGRRLGPVGTAARVAGGLGALVLPIAQGALTWWDPGAALTLLPLTAIAVATALSAAPVWVRSLLSLVAVIAVEIGATFASPLDGASAIWIFLGVSLLIAAVRGDAGCEAVAIPNAIAGRSDSTGCVIYSPLDAAEARRARAFS